MKTEKIVLGNEMETPSWSLRKEILNFDQALTAYDCMSTDADIPHVYFSLCLASWVSDINRLIRAYIADLDKGECDEVLGIDFQAMTKKEYWLKSGKLESYLIAMNGKPLSDYLSSRLFEAKAETTTDDIFRSIDEGVSEMVELLKEVKRKTMEAPPEFYENFYHRMKAKQDQEAVTAAYEEWKMGAGRLTFELLKDKQVLTVAEFLKKQILRFTLIPSKWEIDEVCLEKVKRHLPYDYELPDEFEKCCARIRRYISWEGDILRIRYPKYGHYLFQHYHSLSAEERQEFFHLDTILTLIQKDMEKPLPRPLPKKEGEIGRIRECIALLMAEQYGEEPLFNLQGHWQAVYRILVDKGYCRESDFDGFDAFIQRVMPEEVNKPYKKDSVRNINKTSYNKPFDKWKYNSEDYGTRKPFERMVAIAKRFMEILEEKGL